MFYKHFLSVCGLPFQKDVLRMKNNIPCVAPSRMPDIIVIITRYVLWKKKILFEDVFHLSLVLPMIIGAENNAKTRLLSLSNHYSIHFACVALAIGKLEIASSMAFVLKKLIRLIYEKQQWGSPKAALQV